MTNVQLYLTIATPRIAVLTRLTVSMIQVNGIRADMCGMRRDFREDFRALTSEVVEIDNRLSRIPDRLKRL